MLSKISNYRKNLPLKMFSLLFTIFNCFQIVEVLKYAEMKWKWLTSKIVPFTAEGSLLIFVTKKVKSHSMTYPSMKFLESVFASFLFFGIPEQYNFG